MVMKNVAYEAIFLPSALVMFLKKKIVLKICICFVAGGGKFFQGNLIYCLNG